MNILYNNKVVLIDGSLAAELKKFNFDFENDVFWTAKAVIEKPELMKQIHINFLKNGAEIISTGSYQINKSNLMQHLNINADEAYKIIKRSVEVAIEAKNETKILNALVAGSVGPYGATLHDRSEYSGHYVNNMTIEELVEWHRPRVNALIEAGADLLAFETIPSIKEAKSLCKLLEEFPNIKAWLSFSCKNETQLCIGDDFSIAYETFRHNNQIIAIGINCTHSTYIMPLLKSVREYSKPFVVYPNDGSFVTYLDNDIINNLKPIDLFKQILPEWIKLGTKFIGGCCGFTSESINELRRFIDEL